MKKKLNEFMKKLQLKQTKPNRMDNPTVQLFRTELKLNLEELIPVDSPYISKASTGQNPEVMAEVSWFAVFDKRFIRKASGEFYYLVYLFRSDGRGFYLSLNQSWTNIKSTEIRSDDNKRIKPREVALEYSKILRSYIDSTYRSRYITSQIDLGANNDLGMGYEVSNIIAKYYAYDNFSARQIENDFEEMLVIYNKLVEEVPLEKYKSLLVENSEWIKDSVSLDRELASSKLKKSLVFSEIKDNYSYEDYSIDNSKNRKISDQDLQEKNEKQSDLGKKAEKLAYEYYLSATERIVSPDIFASLKDRIINVGQIHGYGYDIKAFDLEDLEKGKENEIHIEVKATKSKKGTTPFYITRNELKQAIIDKEKYRILRIYDFESMTPMFDELNLFKDLDNIDSTESIEKIVSSFLNITPNSYIVTGWKKNNSQ